MKVLITVKGGKCQGDIHKPGQTFTVGETIPAGICSSAWDAVAPYVMTLKYGGDFPWEREKGMAEIHCPDTKGIVLEVRRMED